MPSVALLGSGLLGEAIGRRLLDQSVELKVWNRTHERCQTLIQEGAQAFQIFRAWLRDAAPSSPR